VCKTGEIPGYVGGNSRLYIYLEKLGKVPSAAAYGIRIVNIIVIFRLFLREQVAIRRPAAGRH